MRWYERITESAAFKRLDDPRTRLGHALVTVTALAFALTAFAQNPNPSRDCQTNPLRAVYNPKRLKVVRTCQQIKGTVVHVAKERDGDLHIQLAVADKSLLTPRNYSGQGGYLVAEYMPGDSYPRPRIDQALQLGCTYVYDLQHGGWAECHPVFSVQPLGSTPVEP